MRLLMANDRIEKRIVLNSTRERVWRAISESRRFGAWFGVEFDGPFVEGTWVTGRIAPTKVDPDVAKMQEPHIGKQWLAFVERIEPMTKFTFRWHPFAVSPDIDYTKEPTTLVTFELRDVNDGILLTITDAGFDQIPPARRVQAIEASETGWAHQTRLIEKYLTLDGGS
jgi:uncharacterized protein YndB with AHSA1/START domain